MPIPAQTCFVLLLAWAVAMPGLLLADDGSDSAITGRIERQTDSDGERAGPESGRSGAVTAPDRHRPRLEPGTGQPMEPPVYPEVDLTTEQDQPPQQISSDQVSRFAYTTDIHDREPVDSLNRLHGDVAHVYYFTELNNMTGQNVLHRWEYGGEIHAQVEFNVGGPRWRVWSRKDIPHQFAGGQWTVSVINAAGEVIHQTSIEQVHDSFD